MQGRLGLLMAVCVGFLWMQQGCSQRKPKPTKTNPPKRSGLDKSASSDSPGQVDAPSTGYGTGVDTSQGSGGQASSASSTSGAGTTTGSSSSSGGLGTSSGASSSSSTSGTGFSSTSSSSGGASSGSTGSGFGGGSSSGYGGASSSGYGGASSSGYGGGTSSSGGSAADISLQVERNGSTISVQPTRSGIELSDIQYQFYSARQTYSPSTTKASGEVNLGSFRPSIILELRYQNDNVSAGSAYRTGRCRARVDFNSSSTGNSRETVRCVRY